MKKRATSTLSKKLRLAFIDGSLTPMIIVDVKCVPKDLTQKITDLVYEFMVFIRYFTEQGTLHTTLLLTKRPYSDTDTRIHDIDEIQHPDVVFL